MQGGNSTVTSRPTPPSAKTVAFASVGCRTNQEEMEALRGELRGAGFSVSDDLKTADIIIVNTCSVTSHAESKTKRLLLAIAREAPRAKVVATGCLAQQKGEELLGLGNVSWVVGNARKHEIPAIVRSTRHGVFSSDLAASVLTLPQALTGPAASGRTRFSVKIQEGCNFACAYCIVPRLRGPSRCAPEEKIVDSCRAAIEVGYKELVLTGTHIGQFRRGAGEPSGGLVALVERLAALRGDFRLRLSSLDPRELPDDLLARIGEGGVLCDHLHVSLQSLCGEVLRGMARAYEDLDALIGKLAAFRARYPFAGLGADFIVGFPGETDAHFETTLRHAERIGFSYGHVFRFSRRPGTAAAVMDGQVPESLKTERSARLRAVIARSRELFVKSQCGRTRRIIAEQEAPVRGVAANYLSVEIPARRVPHNSWCEVVLDGTARSGKHCGARLAHEALLRSPERQIRSSSIPSP